MYGRTSVLPLPTCDLVKPCPHFSRNHFRPFDASRAALLSVAGQPGPRPREIKRLLSLIAPRRRVDPPNTSPTEMCTPSPFPRPGISKNSLTYGLPVRTPFTAKERQPLSSKLDWQLFCRPQRAQPLDLVQPGRALEAITSWVPAHHEAVPATPDLNVTAAAESTMVRITPEAARAACPKYAWQ